MKINVINVSEEKLDEEEIIRVVEYVLKEEKFNIEQDKELNIKITNNEEIARLNGLYRNVKGPTDVLSFGYGLEEPVIGDIVISAEKIKEQAPKFGNAFLEEFYYILIHGILHILGYDHEYEDVKSKEMFEKQDEYFQYIKEKILR